MALEVSTGVTSSVTLADFTSPALIAPDLRASDVAGVISDLSRRLQAEGFLTDVLSFYHAALNQELMFNSAQDCGVAFPHARLSGIRQLQYALGRVQQPITWGPKGSWPVQLVFLLAVPATDGAQYLHLLASLARLSQEPGLLNGLRTGQGAAGMFAALERVGVRQAA
jgi:mannitol/fructose-specific phosphotransferase system IIA component (Ntr-type)